jgi:WD40 repeat protein
MQRAHNGPVLALARSTGSESWLVSGGRDGHLQRWSLVGLNPLGAAWKAHSDAINSLSIDPTGKTLVSASEDGTLRRWNALTGDALGVPMQGHAGPVYSVAFSPDGQRVLSGGADTSLRLWNAQTGSAVEGPLQRHSAAVTAVSFDPTNSSRAASASRDGTILVWDVNQRIPVRPALRGHAGPIYSLDVSASGRELFTAGADTTIRIWDRRSGRPLLQPLSGHQVDIQRVLALPDATDLRLVSADRQGELRLWRIQRPPSDWPKRLCAHLLHRSETCTSSSSTEP